MFPRLGSSSLVTKWLAITIIASVIGAMDGGFLMHWASLIPPSPAPVDVPVALAETTTLNMVSEKTAGTAIILMSSTVAARALPAVVIRTALTRLTRAKLFIALSGFEVSERRAYSQ